MSRKAWEYWASKFPRWFQSRKKECGTRQMIIFLSQLDDASVKSLPEPLDSQETLVTGWWCFCLLHMRFLLCFSLLRLTSTKARLNNFQHSLSLRSPIKKSILLQRRYFFSFEPINKTSFLQKIPKEMNLKEKTRFIQNF